MHKIWSYFSGIDRQEQQHNSKEMLRRLRPSADLKIKSFISIPRKFVVSCISVHLLCFISKVYKQRLIQPVDIFENTKQLNTLKNDP